MLSKRLKSLVKYVKKHDKVIDIGCDHALLDIYLIKKGYLDSVIVSDVHERALESGISNIKRERFEEKINARLGNGLEVLSDEDIVDTIIISGMGTRTILDILNNSYLPNIDKLILQSNRDYDILRREVIKLGFYIVNEEVVIDNDKIYINIVFLRGNKEYSELELKYGTKNMKNKEHYFNYILNKKEEILNRVKNESLREKILGEINLIKNLK